MLASAASPSTVNPMPQLMQSGLEILLGRERYAALCRAAHLTGLGMASVIRAAVDAHLDDLEHRGVSTHDEKVVAIRGSGRHRAPTPQDAAAGSGRTS